MIFASAVLSRYTTVRRHTCELYIQYEKLCQNSFQMSSETSRRQQQCVIVLVAMLEQRKGRLINKLELVNFQQCPICPWQLNTDLSPWNVFSHTVSKHQVTKCHRLTGDALLNIALSTSTGLLHLFLSAISYFSHDRDNFWVNFQFNML